MRKLKWATLPLVFAIVSVLGQGVGADVESGLQIDQEHTQWIQKVMNSISTIKPGMTRKDLSRVFTTEGGLSTRSERRYVYKHCQNIKVDIQFSPVDPSTRVPTTRS
jgi:hypothetical protein